MKRSITVLLLLAAASAAAPETIVLGWSQDWGAQYKSSRHSTTKSPPDGVNAPDGEGIRYVAIDLEPNRVLLVAVQPGHEPPRAWIDLDLDGQLANETPIEFDIDNTRAMAEFRIAWRDSKDSAPHSVSAAIGFDGDLSDGLIHFQLRGHRQAQVVFGGRLRRVAVVDGQIHVDLDGDGWITPGPDSHERVQPGEAFRAGDRGYALRRGAASAATLRLERSETAPPPRAKAWFAPRKPIHNPPRTVVVRESFKELVDKYKADTRNYGTGGGALLQSIGGIGTPKSVRFLLHVVRSEKSRELRRSAADALGVVSNRPHAKTIMTAARNLSDPALAVDLLMSLDAMEVPARHVYYLKLLDSTRHRAVQSACVHLAAGAGRARRAELLSRVGTFKRPWANYLAYWYGTRFDPSPPSDDVLSRAMLSKDARLRLRALGDAVRLGREGARMQFMALATEELVKNRTRDAEMARLTIEVVGPVAGAPEMPLLFAALRSASRNSNKRMVHLLGLVRNEAVEAFIRSHLADKEAWGIVTTIRILAQLPDPKNGEALAAHLPKENYYGVRVPLIEALGRLRVQSAATELARIARREKRDKASRDAAMVAIARLGLAAEPIRKLFDEQGNSRDWFRRLDAADVLARYADATAVSWLAKRLEDDEWRVRIAAARGLGRIRTKEAVGPLIARLGREEHGRTRRAMADALFRITGQHLYDIHELWMKWWSDNRERFVVPTTLPLRQKGKGGRKTVARFYGVPVDSERVAMVLDQSGSMGTSERGGAPTDFDRAVKETLKVAARMRDGALFNVILFGSEVHPWAKTLIRLTKQSRADLGKHLSAQKPTGGTNLYDALEFAIKMPGVDSIFLLSDGFPSDGKFQDRRNILREIGKLNKRRRIQIHCVALGWDSTLLKELAAQTGGTYRRH